MTDRGITAAERARFCSNRAAVNEELEAMVAEWRQVRGGFEAALFAVTQTLVDTGPSRDDLLRLVAYAVGRLAEGGVAELAVLRVRLKDVLGLSPDVTDHDIVMAARRGAS